MSGHTNQAIVEDIEEGDETQTNVDNEHESKNTSVAIDIDNESDASTRETRDNVVVYIGDSTQNNRHHVVSWDINNSAETSSELSSDTSTTNEPNTHENCTAHVNNTDNCDDSSDTTRCSCNCHAIQHTVSYSNPAFSASQSNLTDNTINSSSVNTITSSASKIEKERFQSSKSLPQYTAGLTLKDEPPKYEEVTGNKLATQLDESNKDRNNTSSSTANARNRGRTSGSLKRRIAGAGIFLAVLVVTILLIYLSITGATGNLQQNDSGNQ